MDKATIEKMVKETGHQLDTLSMIEKEDNPGMEWAIRVPGYAMADYFCTLEDVHAFCEKTNSDKKYILQIEDDAFATAMINSYLSVNYFNSREEAEKEGERIMGNSDWMENPKIQISEVGAGMRIYGTANETFVRVAGRVFLINPESGDEFEEISEMPEEAEEIGPGIGYDIYIPDYIMGLECLS